jgi:hypothetical protein
MGVVASFFVLKSNSTEVLMELVNNKAASFNVKIQDDIMA